MFRNKLRSDSRSPHHTAHTAPWCCLSRLCYYFLVHVCCIKVRIAPPFWKFVSKHFLTEQVTRLLAGTMESSSPVLNDRTLKDLMKSATGLSLSSIPRCVKAENDNRDDEHFIADCLRAVLLLDRDNYESLNLLTTMNLSGPQEYAIVLDKMLTHKGQLAVYRSVIVGWCKDHNIDYRAIEQSVCAFQHQPLSRLIAKDYQSSPSIAVPAEAPTVHIVNQVNYVCMVNTS